MAAQFLNISHLKQFAMGREVFTLPNSSFQFPQGLNLQYIYTTILILTMNTRQERQEILSFRFSLTAMVPCWLPFNMEDHPLLQASFNNKLEYKIEKTKYFPCSSKILHGSWLSLQQLTHEIDSDHIVRCYCVCCLHLRVKWKKSRFETSLGRKQLDLCF